MSQSNHDQHSPSGVEGQPDHGGVGKYIVVFIALCFLTSCSFMTYSHWWPWKETPAVGWTFMMAVSCTKAMLVILFFMHVLHEANWKYVLTIPATFMAIFLGLALVPDIGMRMRNVSEERLLHMAEPPAEVHAGEHGATGAEDEAGHEDGHEEPADH